MYFWIFSHPSPPPPTSWIICQKYPIPPSNHDKTNLALFRNTWPPNATCSYTIYSLFTRPWWLVLESYGSWCFPGSIEQKNSRNQPKSHEWSGAHLENSSSKFGYTQNAKIGQKQKILSIFLAPFYNLSWEFDDWKKIIKKCWQSIDW
jgi:hypothetical protein